jgi:hypothetical protein
MNARRLPALAFTVALTVELTLGGCAGPQRQRQESATSTFRDPGLSVLAARDRLLPGQTRQAEVLATLGPATVVRFASGYQVWVYRVRPDRRDAEAAEVPELVILFSPAGVVQKARIRLPADRPR